MMTKLVLTADNSATLFSEYFGEHYHSINGAFTETMHIFIGLGLNKFKNTKINILEVGYGTGLNAICSLKFNKELGNDIFYHGIDVFPIEKALFDKLNYSDFTNEPKENLEAFYSGWDSIIHIKDNFVLYKQLIDIKNFVSEKKYDIVYFDAFSPETQPEMWTEDIFIKLSTFLSTGAILVTYCSKGIVKQNLRNAGFVVKRFSGPPGKRHVLCASKI